MSKNRMINTRFWSDSFVVDLNPLDRYLFLYLLTNEHTEICGIYELPLKVMARETGLDVEMLEKMFDRMSPKIFYVDGWVYLRNFDKHQKTNPSVKKGIERALESVPDEIMAKIKQINTGSDSLSQSVAKSRKPKPKLKPKPKGNTLSSPPADDAPFDSEKYIQGMIENKQKHIHVIGLYWRFNRFEFPSAEAARAAMKRDLRAGRALTGYPDRDILDVMAWLDQHAKQNNYKWTLETVHKEIDHYRKAVRKNS